MRRTFARALALALALFVLGTSFALIMSTTLAVLEVTPPLSVVQGQEESNAQIIAFNETVSAVTLAQPLVVNISADPGVYDDCNDLTPAAIPLGTVVESHLLHLDPVMTTQVSLSGSVTFQARILGVIVLDAELDASDATLGCPTTLYPTGAVGRGLEFDAQSDLVEIMSGGHELRVSLESCCVLDQIRVITAQQDATLVADVLASQRLDASKLVDVYYTLAYAPPDPNAVVTLAFGQVDPNDPNSLPTPFTVAGAAWGHVGANVGPGLGRHIIWDPATDCPDCGGDFRVQVQIGVDFAVSPAFAITAAGDGELVVTVRDPNGDPVQGATVIVPGEGSGKQTDQNGQVTFSSVDAGKTTVTVVRDPGDPNRVVVREVGIRESSTTSATIVLVPVPSIQGPEVVEVTSQFCGPDQHANYLRDVPLDETFTARIDWHEAKYATPFEVRWYIGTNGADPDELVRTDHYYAPPPPDTASQTFHMDSDFVVGDKLTVVAVAVANGTVAEWRSHAYITNFDVAETSVAFPADVLDADTSGPSLEYVVREHECIKNAVDEGGGGGGKIEVPIPSWIPFLGGLPLAIGSAGEVDGAIHGDGTTETSYESSEELPLEPYNKVGPIKIAAKVGGQFLLWLNPATGDWDIKACGYHLKIEGEESWYYPIHIPPPLFLAVIVGFNVDLTFDVLGWKEMVEELRWDPEYVINAVLTPWVEGVGSLQLGDWGKLEGYIRGAPFLHLCYSIIDPESCEPACWEGSNLKRFGLFIQPGVRAYWMSFRLFHVYKRYTHNVCGSDGKYPEQSSGWTRLGPRPIERADVGEPHDVFVADTAPRQRSQRGTTTVTPVVHRVFPHTVPDLSAVGSDLLLVWVRDNGTRGATNRTEVVYSRRGAMGVWDPNGAPVDPNDATADDNPQLAVFPDNAHAVLAWEDVNDVLIEPNEPGDPCITECQSDPNYTECLYDCKLEEMKSKTEISVAVYDPNANSWGSQQFRSQNTHLDRGPQIATASDNTAMLVWVAETGDANNPSYTLHYSRYASGSWSGTASNPQTIAAGLGSVIDIALAYKGDEAVVVYNADTDDDPNTADDEELFCSVYSGSTWTFPPIALTTDPTNNELRDAEPQVVYAAAGTPVLIWHRCGDFYAADINTAGPTLTNKRRIVDLAVAPPAGGEFRLAPGPGGKLALVWQSVGAGWHGVGQDPNDYTNHGQLGDPVSVNVDIWYALYDPSYAGASVWSEPLQLTADGFMERSMAPIYITDPNDPNGAILTMAYEKVTVTYAEPFTYLIEDPDFPGEPNAPRAILMENVCVPQSGDADLHLLEHQIGGDLAILAAEIQVSPANPCAGSQAEIRAVLRNLGDLSASNVDVSFYQVDPNNTETEINTVTVGRTLVGGACARLSVPWIVPPASAASQVRVRIGTALPGDQVPSNDEATVDVFAPDLAIANITIHQIGSDRIIRARVANVGAESAAAINVVIRDPNDVILPGAEFSIALLLPGAYKDVSYRWENAPTGRHLISVVVDPNDTIPEPIEGNNTRHAQILEFTGACCVPGGGCQPGWTQAQCSAFGGGWRGAGTTCTPDPCPPCRGDTNCDGQIDFGDINPFVDAILCVGAPDPEGCWAAQYPGCPYLNADINDSGAVTFGDINPFVNLLISSTLPRQCP